MKTEPGPVGITGVIGPEGIRGDMGPRGGVGDRGDYFQQCYQCAIKVKLIY